MDKMIFICNKLLCELVETKKGRLTTLVPCLALIGL